MINFQGLFTFTLTFILLLLTELTLSFNLRLLLLLNCDELGLNFLNLLILASLLLTVKPKESEFVFFTNFDFIQTNLFSLILLALL